MYKKIKGIGRKYILSPSDCFYMLLQKLVFD